MEGDAVTRHDNLFELAFLHRDRSIDALHMNDPGTRGVVLHRKEARVFHRINRTDVAGTQCASAERHAPLFRLNLRPAIVHDRAGVVGPEHSVVAYLVVTLLDACRSLVNVHGDKSRSGRCCS